jgi:RNA polymerase sigma factor (sigma-70 family)
VKDLRIVARVYNNQLRERREALGLTATALAEAANIQATTYCALESMKISPLTSTIGPFGKPREPRWTKTVERLAEYHKETPEALFPEATREMRKTVAEIRVNAEEVHALMASPVDSSPLRLLCSAETEKTIHESLDVLLPREREVIEMRFGLDDGRERTFAEIGECLQLSVERVRQIELKALWRLRQYRGVDLASAVEVQR